MHKSRNHRNLFVGVGYDDNGPHFIFDNVSQEPWCRWKYYVVGKEISITRLKGRFCVGRYRLSDFSSTSCPERRRLGETRTVQCHACSSASGFNPAFYNLRPEQISEAQKIYNLQPHDVYLVYFGDSTIKVGISNSQRTMTRWLEQGAILAKVVTRCSSAYEARGIEQNARSALGIQEQISTRQKIVLLNGGINLSHGLSRLEDMAKKLVGTIGVEGAENEAISLLGRYGLGCPIPALGGRIEDVSRNRPLTIFGPCIALIGGIALTEINNAFWAVSTKDVISHLVAFNHEVGGPKIEQLQQRLL
jgi:hypothetical protein